MTGAELAAVRLGADVGAAAVAREMGVTRQRLGRIESQPAVEQETRTRYLHAVETIAAARDRLPPPARPVPLACPICGLDTTSGPRNPAVLLVEHLRAEHPERAGVLIDEHPEAGGPFRARRLPGTSRGWLVAETATDLHVLFEDWPFAAHRFPASDFRPGGIGAQYDWQTASVPDGEEASSVTQEGANGV